MQIFYALYIKRKKKTDMKSYLNCHKRIDTHGEDTL